MALLSIPVLLTGCSGQLSTLDPAGPSAHSAAWLWWAMFGFASLVLLVLVALWLYASHRTPGASDSQQPPKSLRRLIVGGGLVLPLASITALLIFGIPAGHQMLPLPVEGELVQIEVVGHQWWWEVSYPDTEISLVNEVHIPAGVPVDVHLRSADVIHSFWVPRLGGKVDMIPGRTNVLRLQADEPGTYQGQCAEFCGSGHAHMHFVVQAHTPENYRAWLADAQSQNEPSPEDPGQNNQRQEGHADGH